MNSNFWFTVLKMTMSAVALILVPAAIGMKIGTDDALKSIKRKGEKK